MALSEQAFTTLVTAGCTTCPSKKLIVEAYVTQKMPLLAGEPYGSPSWGYKGEDLVRGTYRVSCADCTAELFKTTPCPHCGGADGVDRALAEENASPFDRACKTCGCELLTAMAYVPATVVYEGKRTAKARTQTAPEDPGFHTLHVTCNECRSVELRERRCPLCAAPTAA